MSKRDKTKDELSRLAEILVSKYQIETILGTGDFLETALSEARRSNIQISGQSIRKYEKDIALKCQSLKEHIAYQITQNRVREEVKSQPVVVVKDDNFYDSSNNVVSKRDILKRADEIRGEIENEYFGKDDELFSNTFMDDINSIFDFNKPNYTLFNEVDGKITIQRGKYSRDEFTNKSPKEINEISGWSRMAGWANKMLEDNLSDGENRPGALTEDDKIVLRRIMRNEI
jgi:hypothetical protein